MNFAIIFYILGSILKLEAAFMLLPFGVSLIYREKDGVFFLTTAAICFLLGLLMTRKKPKNSSFYAKESFVVVSLGWVMLSIVGCLPFFISREIPSFTNALFETVSGFTTTGASILPHPETLGYGMQFWRCFTHWIGGMGILVFMLAVLPSAGGQNLYLMRAESPGPSVGKLTPKIQQTAKYLYAIYFAMTVAEFVLLLLAGMSVFDAVCTAISTAGTGGFGIRGDSLASYSTVIQCIVTVFMVLFGINFSFYYLLLMKKVKEALKIEEVRAYLLLYLGAVAALTLSLLERSSNILHNLKDAAFQAASIMTTTGFATTDFNQWPEFAKMVLLALMFFGGCAGSTSGGIKVSRFLMYFKSLRKELNRLAHPRSVKTLTMDEKAISGDVIHSTLIFLMAYLLVFGGSLLLLSLNGFDFITNFSAVAATINNVGPGLELVGPTSNFSIFSTFSKYILMFNMIAGRLEIFPMLILFTPGNWKKG